MEFQMAEKVLVVEDDRNLLDTLKYNLRKRGTRRSLWLAVLRRWISPAARNPISSSSISCSPS
jgi:ActR/RegA family two-component response regulator